MVQLRRIIKDYRKTTLTKVPLFNFVGNLDKRWRTIGKFLHQFLSRYKNPKILDLAMGSGQDSVYLLKEGHDVISNEIDEQGIALARRAALKYGVKLNIRRVNWIDIHDSSEYKGEEFNLIFSLGNSFPNYLLKSSERVKALKGFWRILKRGGMFIFDTRNFDYMLENTETILQNPEKNFNYSYKTTYIGRSIKGFPVEITPEKVRLLWKHKRNKTYTTFDLWPATTSNVKNMIREVIGDVKYEIFYDFKRKKPKHYDFAQYVLKK